MNLNDSDDNRFDFSSDESARDSMKEFIREQFGDLLGEKISLLDEPDWPRLIKQEFAAEIKQSGEQLPRDIEKLMSLLRNLQQ